MNVYGILCESGVAEGDFQQSDLYRESLRLGLIAGEKSQAPAIPDAAERRESVFQVTGMWCASCGWLIEHALRRERGIVSADVLFASDLLRVVYCPQYVPSGTIERRVASIGYRVAPFTGETEPARRENRDLLLRLGVAAALWMNVMLFSLVIYAGYFEGIADWARRAVPLILLALATPAVFYSGWPILRLAWLGIRHGALRMETLISTGVLAAYGYGIAQILRGGRHFYFDTACAIVTLVLAGKAIERGAKSSTARSLSTLHRMLPKKARVLLDGRERFVSVDALERDMLVLVKPGERIPADGVVVEGESSAEESIITGESRPRNKSVGDEVVGGSLNGAGVLTFRVSRSASESTLAHIVKSVESAMAAQSHAERAVDRLSRIFIPAVLLAAVVTLGVSAAARVDPMDALMRSIAVLVIACPCALGIATPLAMTAAIGAASRSGVLLRHSSAFESIRNLNTLVLDKTGSATEGLFRVRQAWWRKDGLRMLAALESRSEHPVGQAIAALESDPVLPVLDVTVRKGCGIAGLVGGVRVVAGNRAMMALENAEIDAEIEARAADWERAGSTTVFCAIGGECAGALALGDEPRADANCLIRALEERGIHVVLLSGDSIRTTAHIAARLGITEFQGEVLPQRKAEFIEERRARGEIVGMVGDGINDAPALATADLGIAMATGSDLATQSAPVVLLSDSLMKIPDILDLAGRTRSIIRTNLFWALVYNVAGIVLAATGILSPIFSAAAMVLSSACVIGNSQRLNRDPSSSRRAHPAPAA